MKKILLSCSLLALSGLAFSQVTLTPASPVNSSGIDTMKRVAAPVESRKEPVINDEGTNIPGSEYEKTTFNGQDIYIKQDSKITIIYEPNH
jgi:hypothetical protein